MIANTESPADGAEKIRYQLLDAQQANGTPPLRQMLPPAIQQSLKIVGVYFNRKKSPEYNGSAFLVHKSHERPGQFLALTAAHCDDGDTIELRWGTAGPIWLGKAKTIISVKKLDYKLLNVTFPETLELEPARVWKNPYITQNIYSSGYGYYPCLFDNGGPDEMSPEELTTHKTAYDRLSRKNDFSQTYSEGTSILNNAPIFRNWERESPLETMALYDLFTLPGDSGSPVFNGDHNVIGIRTNNMSLVKRMPWKPRPINRPHTQKTINELWNSEEHAVGTPIDLIVTDITEQLGRDRIQGTQDRRDVEEFLSKTE